MVTWDLGVKVWGLGSQKVGCLGAPGKYRTHKENLGVPISDSVGGSLQSPISLEISSP